jgi:hypothetical protein
VTVTVTVKERQLALLEWFVVRARRLEEHSLAQDKDQLLTWASGTFTVRGVQGQPPTSVRWDLPPEEPLDSLAARCRPFILKNDPVYWVNVTGALGYFLRDQDAEDLTARLGALRTSWRGLDKDTPGSLGFQSGWWPRGRPRRTGRLEGARLRVALRRPRPRRRRHPGARR